jgi:hypothetical protein
MTVSLTISGESAGDPIAEVNDFGSFSPGAASDAIDLYIRHDAQSWEITDCAFYVVQYVGSSYTGDNDPNADYAEVLSWGDTSGASANGVEITDPSHGGFYMNMDHSGSFPDADWHPFRSTYGADASNAVELEQEAINNTGVGWTPVDGQIPLQGEAHIQMRWDIPDTVGNAGTKFVQLVMAYSYTS